MLSCLVKHVPQIPQENGLFPECFVRCRFALPFSEKVWSQIVQRHWYITLKLLMFMPSTMCWSKNLLSRTRRLSSLSKVAS